MRHIPFFEPDTNFIICLDASASVNLSASPIADDKAKRGRWAETYSG